MFWYERCRFEEWPHGQRRHKRGSPLLLYEKTRSAAVLHERHARLDDRLPHRLRVRLHVHLLRSGGRLCTLIGVPWRGVSFSTLSTGRFVLKQYICKGAESAEHAETAGYTYEGTPTTA